MGALDPAPQAGNAVPMKIEGGCHCRAVRFAAEVSASVEILDCNCSICAATGFRHLIVPHGDFWLASGEAA
jgi:hypothetical protein